ncbi:mediator of RNA polymerase II transcription subunit 13 [Monascus purpureus]|uniref:Mediator of RNA polymerase II transcription subunit 13 n=1 Tax=Monascus purpureus TaxID=5098 RepID=A0A507R2B2_MONPU|nr:mediator of RNA polymerase II transcription subunit 13 [Monascus purpureus]BDD62911.1 hypothetical protein MAP00_007864 [Monascus purpureus]
MDFPGGSITNVRVIDGFSNIHWRIYTDEHAVSSLPPEAPANGYTILKHLSRLKDLELQLKNLGCLVSSYPRRLGLWLFSATPGFESVSSLSLNGSGGNSTRLLVGSTTLKLSASGSITSAELVKNLSDPQASSASTVGSQKPQNGSTLPRRMDNYGSSAAIYASFISAITGAINFKFVRLHNALPLGSRTLFTAVERDGFESPRVVNDSPVSMPALTTLQIQLTPVGKLIVSMQTIAQTGLSRLWEPGDLVSELSDLQPNIDLWLCPNGSIARLVSANVDNPDLSSPSSPSGCSGVQETSARLFTANRKQWKSNVLEWLTNFGLSTDTVEDEPWVEIEVCEFFYARLAGEISRRSEDTPALPLKRFLWPARYCFARSTPIPPETPSNRQSIFSPCNNPLEFAEQWYLAASSKCEDAGSEILSGSRKQQQQPNGQGMSPLRPESLEEIESLSRLAQYPDLQTASLVYPTPPDGAVGLNYKSSLDAFMEDPGTDSLQPDGRNVQKSDQAQFSEDPEPNLTMDFGPAAGLTVGSGLYDTSGDDDLFGEMNDKDFGSKGITDADFSFFDDPELGIMEGRTELGGTEAGEINESTEHAIDPPEVAQVPSSIDEKTPKSYPANDLETPMANIEFHESFLSSPFGKPTSVHENQACLIDAPPSPHRENSQTISPPLSPLEIKRILFSGAAQSDHFSVKEGRRQGDYNPVPFKQNLNEWNQKYGTDGRFSFSAASATTAQDPGGSASDIPTIGLRHRGRKVTSSLDGVLNPANRNDNDLDGMVRQLRSTSVSSDDSDETTPEPHSSSGSLRVLKRKRSLSDPGDSMPSPSEKPMVIPNLCSTPSKAEISVFLGNFVSIFSDWSLTGYFSFPQARLSPVLPGKEEYVRIAQLLVDQLTLSSLNHKIHGRMGLSDIEKDFFSLPTFLDDANFVGETERLHLKDYVSLQDNEFPFPSSGSSQPETPRHRESGNGSLLKLPPPHLRIRRGRDFLEVLPPAIWFWETFGLEPAHGTKDISAYCIHPHLAGEAADVFLDRLGLQYSNCGLGKHVRGKASKAFERALVPWSVKASDASGYFSALRSLKALCDNLGSLFSQNQPVGDNVVVYIINPFNHGTALADICSAFLQLLQKYLTGVDRRQTPRMSEIVLQVIPLEFVTSAGSIVVPTQTEYMNLALEVYSRCAARNSASNVLSSAPPVLLVEPILTAINFRLTSERTSPLREGKCLHLAYSRSLDQRWITVAWSDNTGSFQRTMSYCLRFRNQKATRSISDVRNEIWGTTKGIMEKIQAQWRFMLALTEPVDQDEVEAWTSLVEQHNKIHTVPLELIILNVNATPDLYLEPPPQPMPINMFNPQTSSPYASTPNPSGSVSSPEQYGNAATPTSGVNIMVNPATPTEFPLEIDSESQLTDICDESWAVILSHRLNNSPHLTEYKPSLASGYLLRRKGPTESDGMLSMTVNLIYTRRVPSTYEMLLKEALGMYRDLACLARVRGTCHVQRNTLPWHIATAVRGQEILSYIL